MERVFLICYEQNNKRSWDMLKGEDREAFMYDLMHRQGINPHSIFVIPTTGMMLSGLWVWDTHTSSEVDFLNFFEEYGAKCHPKISQEARNVIDSLNGQNIKEFKIPDRYGYIAPDGRFLRCECDKHKELADQICFGLVKTDDAEQYLYDNGWCKVYRPATGNNQYALSVNRKCTVTENQINTIVANRLDNADNIEFIRKQSQNP